MSTLQLLLICGTVICLFVITGLSLAAVSHRWDAIEAAEPAPGLPVAASDRVLVHLTGDQSVSGFIHDVRPGWLVLVDATLHASEGEQRMPGVYYVPADAIQGLQTPEHSVMPS